MAKVVDGAVFRAFRFFKNWKFLIVIVAPIFNELRSQVLKKWVFPSSTYAYKTRPRDTFSLFFKFDINA